MEEGEDRCGEMGTVPWKTASGDGMKKAQRRSESLQNIERLGARGWGKCEEKVGISISFGSAQREKHDNRVLKETMSMLGQGLEYRNEIPSQM